MHTITDKSERCTRRRMIKKLKQTNECKLPVAKLRAAIETATNIAFYMRRMHAALQRVHFHTSINRQS